MSRFLIFSLAILLSLASCSGVSTEESSFTIQSDFYKEYVFDSGEDIDLGFTHRAFERLEEEQVLLSSGSLVREDQVMSYDRLTETEMESGLIERYTWGGDAYELTEIGEDGNKASGTYQILKNGQVLFEEPMFFGADGPIQDWRIVEGKPAFTFRSACKVEDNGENCTNDIWYDGSLISEQFSVENPRYLFSYDGKLGFVASKDGMDSIFYDGSFFVTPGFTIIWTHNCCSLTEILPTVYENGTLLFYAKRGEGNYLVEASL